MSNSLYLLSRSVLAFIVFACSTLCPVLHAQAAIPRIINGTPVSSRNSPVVQVLQRTQGGYYICSGSIIAPNAILTASHCVARSPSIMSVVIAGKKFGVRKVTVHPDARKKSNGLILNDAAIVFLQNPTSKPKLGLLVSRVMKTGYLVTILGYGRDDWGNYGALRKGISTIWRISSGFLITLFNSSKRSTSCSGDSGGPAIYGYFDSQRNYRSGIVGIVSAGTSDQCGYGDQSYYLNVQATKILTFIMSKVPTIRTE